MKYVGDITDTACDVKRLYVNDLIINKPCPKCGENVELDFSQNYISYGNGNLNFYCYDGCEHEWEIEAEITATVILETKE